MGKILILSSRVHENLAEKQLSHCLEVAKKSTHEIQIEKVAAGTYELPFVIQAYHKQNPFDGYIALGLVLKANLDHYEYIMSHIKTCFTQFALQNIAVGSGIITGIDLQDLANKIDNPDPCVSAYASAFQAVNYLINLMDEIEKSRFIT